MKKLSSFYIKLALIVSGVLIAFFILYYTQTMVNRIRQREKDIANIYAKSLEYIANDTTNTNGDYSFIFTQIIPQIDFPMIATDSSKFRITFSKNIDVDSTKSHSEISKYLAHELEFLKTLNEPIVVRRDSLILSYVYYGESGLVTQLKYLPVIELIIATLFIFVGYIGFSSIKKHEQSSIWVGLSRETAHQLGTPLSSLMGWVEILKGMTQKDDNIKDVTNEISNDIEKLSKIAGRFSKIGSLPKLEYEDIGQVINNVSVYFQKRIPSLASADGKLKKKISIHINNTDEPILAKINKDLFEWVIENLMKNALDAIEKNHGKIDVNISKREDGIIIDVCDNGKGIDKKHRQDVFRPGYSTKKRGWGLGLSLSKRIIDEYHKGKLTIFESAPDKGTIFRIKLNNTED